MNRLFLHFYRLVLIAAAVGLFLFLGNKAFAPSGTLTLEAKTGKPSPFFSRFLPDTRTDEVYRDADGVSWVPIVGDPTYLTITPPSDFREGEIELTYKNHDVPVVELGILTNVESESYKLQPLQNQLLDALAWPQVREGDVVLYDRHGRYQTIADFLVNPPLLGEVAAYNYRLTRPYAIPGYTPSSEERTLDVTLRGEHEVLTYIKNERLRFTFRYMDMNRTLGADPVSIVVLNTAGEPVAGASAEDDGDVSSGGRGSEMKTIRVEGNLPDGVYKIILKVNRDIFFRSITTTQQKMTFLNQVFLGDEVGYQVAPRSQALLTEAKQLRMETQHAEGVQTVSIAGVPVKVSEPFVGVNHRVRATGVSSLTVPSGDLLIRGAGHYAFSRDMYFNPDPTRLEADTDLDGLGINYVIATYTSPQVDGDVVTARTTFTLDQAPKVRGAWKFVLSLPGVADRGGVVDMGRVRITLHRDPLTFSAVVSRLWHKGIDLLGFSL